MVRTLDARSGGTCFPPGGQWNLQRKAKAEGQPVMVETCPHYLLLDETI